MDQPLTTGSAAADQAASNALGPDLAVRPGDRDLAQPRRGAAAGAERDRARPAGACSHSCCCGRPSRPTPCCTASSSSTTAPQIVGRLEALGVAFRLQGDGRAILVPARSGAAPAHDAGRGGPAAGRHRRRRDLRSAERARHHRVPRQRQPAPRARGRARAHHRARWPTSARPGSISCCPGASCSAASRSSRAPRSPCACAAAGASTIARCRPSSTWSPPRCPGCRRGASRWSTITARCWRAAPRANPKARSPTQADELREAYEARLKRTVEQLLERSLGPGRVACRGQRRARFRPGDHRPRRPSIPRARWCAAPRPSRRRTTIAERDDDDAVTVGNNLPNAAAETPAPAAAPTTRTPPAPRRRSTTRSRAGCATTPRSAAGCSACRWRCWSTAG